MKANFIFGLAGPGDTCLFGLRLSRVNVTIHVAHPSTHTRVSHQSFAFLLLAPGPEIPVTGPSAREP